VYKQRRRIFKFLRIVSSQADRSAVQAQPTVTGDVAGGTESCLYSLTPLPDVT